ncbi:DUF6146 family protein [Xanthomarina spongicola]|uniref:Lipoprotein n=1 Tax=Xanthomarina spongicola TaxID=570520 RepID=A0A316DQM9_9FLAO|nr:DUF6146 family protein [Xanthomarina spongicola]PWK19808.1 hypothetical protein LX78_01158 [Xanthomarina spongicola]
MKSIIYILLICGLFYSCKTNQVKETTTTEEQLNVIENDTVRIANEDVEYEIIIIEPGFNTWLITRAKPEGYYEQSFLESRNKQYVDAWNERANQPLRYKSGLYDSLIFYDPTIDYGYEVNYKLYNYFIYFQLTYKQQLTSFIPRI